MKKGLLGKFTILFGSFFVVVDGDGFPKRDISADIVAFDDDSAESDWGRYNLILPTPSLDYTHQYERLLQVRMIFYFLL